MRLWHLLSGLIGRAGEAICALSSLNFISSQLDCCSSTEQGVREHLLLRTCSACLGYSVVLVVIAWLDVQIKSFSGDTLVDGEHVL